MDVYSTALCYLHKHIELSALSEELADSWYLSPPAWCAKGNFLSMHKEHEDAIKFFRRATQVAPRFVYAYTLLGHEYVCTKDLSNARKCFRTAATINPRHYNALFGLGMISLREEDYPAVEMYFKKAFSINSSSCIICSKLAKVKHSLNRSSEALEWIQKNCPSLPQSHNTAGSQKTTGGAGDPRRVSQDCPSRGFSALPNEEGVPEAGKEIRGQAYPS